MSISEESTALSCSALGGSPESGAPAESRSSTGPRNNAPSGECSHSASEGAETSKPRMARGTITGLKLGLGNTTRSGPLEERFSSETFGPRSESATTMVVSLKVPNDLNPDPMARGTLTPGPAV